MYVKFSGTSRMYKVQKFLGLYAYNFYFINLSFLVNILT